MFFDLCRSGRLDGATATLSDSNGDLIGCYQALRDELDDVVRSLTHLERAHRQKGAAHYYDIRDNHFNPARLALVPHAQAPARYPPELAAMLIYLNRTGYNGLFRVNARGEFNVPVGRYENPRICDRDNLARVSAILRQPGVHLQVRTFDALTSHSGPVDFYYFDPPYAPLTTTSRFTAYTTGGFTGDDQRRLQLLAIGLASRGARIVLSNSSAPEVLALYTSDEARKAGLRVIEIPARRAINARASLRGPVRECVITNAPVSC